MAAVHSTLKNKRKENHFSHILGNESICCLLLPSPQHTFNATRANDAFCWFWCLHPYYIPNSSINYDWNSRVHFVLLMDVRHVFINPFGKFELFSAAKANESEIGKDWIRLHSMYLSYMSKLRHNLRDLMHINEILC